MARTQGKFGKHWLSIPVGARLGIAALLGVAAAIATGLHLSWAYSPLVFWDVTALVAGVALWLSVRHMDAAQTEGHASTDDPVRGVVDTLLVLASLASLAAVFVLIIQARHASGLREAIDIGLGVASVVISWTLVHLIYMLRYADLHFKTGKGIDFHGDDAPTYQDFAYVAFTIGMTYQVSDTDLVAPELRKTARQHATISYIFGTAIIATVVNTVAGLGR